MTNENTQVQDNQEELVLNDGILAGNSEAKTQEEYDQLAGECNLYREVSDIFKEKGSSDPEAWAQGRIDESYLKDKPMSYQRLIINRSLRLKLGEYDHDTRNIRYSLIDDGSKEEWKGLVTDVVDHIAKQEKKE